MSGGKEAIEALAIGVSVTFLVVVLYYTVGNVRYGQQMLTSTTTRLEEVQFHSEEDNFRQITSEPVQMPAAAAYALIGYNESRIDGITCSLCGKECKTNVFEDSCLKKHLKGRVSVFAKIDDATKLYHVYIEEVIS